MTAETSQTLDRGLRVLKLLADTDHGLTVTELATKLGVNRTVVYRLLATLEQHALVRRDLGGRARVGLGVLGLAHQVHPLLREAALPALRSLAEDIGATAHLTLVDGSEALAVAVVEPTWTDYHVAYRTGFRHPLDRGAAGRAILAGRGVLPHAPGQEQNGAEPGEGRTEPVRYVLTHGELEAGASGAAAPLIGVTGIEGSVGVVMLAEAVPERVGPRVVEAATEVADALR
ncbi:helix-turn-helix domain-containing protein [Streptomyces sp. SID13666]|uniref:IclR family transcriptional regulator n=1 Tax=Streptomyces fildesensis TaxID=375757 RepID=A0ABW8CDJ5_9ACTN|nr:MULTISPECIES: helix-turn-helix domain-containing protein [Streptomyces]NEA60586.1 helix-turn-helix domain-containing protein [Streptomyces sp. SID13666]NEA76995.1 helix-turn-helix domain-containing protein [Streptomyces sp. SID13588]MCM2419606.1 helix-turn-helix domain-containing protein [Streptomyces sp. RKAG293]MCM2428195.1 helix-turn-helix domain-containing protein [Streptomyces sp. RKAG337]MCZ4100340.1 helix-turn-helix domain-containing protein [Streptomyces sp. H39-C1]